MKPGNQLFLLTTVLLVISCSQMSTTTQQDQSAVTSNLNTYVWGESSINVDRTGETVDRVIDQIAETVRDNVPRLVDEQLIQKGYTPIKEGDPDFIVQYTATGTVQRFEQKNIHTPRVAEGSTELQKSDVIVIGNLTIFITHPVTHKVLWRGQVETLVKGGGKTKVRLQKAITKVFRNFPAK